MAKVFNFMKRASELMGQGVSDEEAAAILEREADEADATVLDDGAWVSLLESVTEGDEEAYQAELAAGRL